MNWKDHFDAYKEHREVIDWAINRGLERPQRIAGSHMSRAIVELLATYLVKEKKMEASSHLNHRWFKSSGEKLPDFPGKNEILKDMKLGEDL